MSTQKHLFQFAAVSILFVVLMGGNEAVAKDKQHKSHNTTLEKKTTSNKRIKHNNKLQLNKAHLYKPQLNKIGVHKTSFHINRVHNVVSHKSHHNGLRKIVGIASYYGYESGKTTAMGTRFNPLGLTAAHKTLPFSSKVRVTNLKNNKSIIVTINDRGPYIRGRILDLSLGAARAIKLGGVGKVSIEIL